MSSTDFADPRHPHEPEVAPVLDAEGRCLVCGCEWRDEQIARLRAALDGVVAWLGVEDWTGPQLPADLARDIAYVLRDTDPPAMRPPDYSDIEEGDEFDGPIVRTPRDA